MEDPSRVEVSVDISRRGVTVPSSAFGMHASLYDNALHDAAVPALLEDAGIELLRWPGGGYSDNYHWATHTMTHWFGDLGNRGYLADDTEFSAFIRVLESFGGEAMITVNYGSNQQSDGPGEPKEAAAWVAYANGSPDDPREIGIDGTGHDWKTVGYWAALRAAEKLTVDDGLNLLRAARPEPLGIRHWEIGNEVFGNGYYEASGNGFEQDLHVPYDGTPRHRHPALSPTTYGQGVTDYLREMKAVDPSIRIGAVLNTPPMDYGWGPDWNERVLAECGDEIDFAIVHWYPPGSVAQVLAAPHLQVSQMFSELANSFATCCNARATPPEIAVTEMGPNIAAVIPATHSQATGLFAAAGYATLLEHGAFNIDWLELHNGSFLDERTQRPGPAYHGLQMTSRFVRPGDTFVEASSSIPHSTYAHAADRADGRVSLMLVNVSPTVDTTVQLGIQGATLAPTAERYDYQPIDGTADGTVTGPSSVSGGNQLSVVVPAYSVVTLIMPRAN